MNNIFKVLAMVILVVALACNKTKQTEEVVKPNATALQTTKNIIMNGVSVNVVIDKPALDEVDVMLLYHGTVMFDDKILEAANNTLQGFKNILDNKNMMLVSVAYPEENLLMGDNIAHSEAALLWVQQKASSELGIRVKKIFLAGHSQGGYIVTRLNTMHATNGVIANAPGPLNLIYRCGLEEQGEIPRGITCNLLRNTYGTTTANPNAYFNRSLLNFTKGFKSDILFVQGLNDSPIQMYSWPVFKQDLKSCNNCKSIDIVEIPGGGHSALFQSDSAKVAFNLFINQRL